MKIWREKKTFENIFHAAFQFGKWQILLQGYSVGSRINLLFTKQKATITTYTMKLSTC